MNADQGSKEASTSAKEKEKLKQRLKLLFKQQEQRAKQKQPQAKLFQKKESQNNERSHVHVNGEPEKKFDKKHKSTNKAAKNKHNHKINGANGKKIVNEEPPTLQPKSRNGSLGRNKKTELKNSNKNAKPHILPAAAKAQQDTQQRRKKKKKSKQADVIQMHEKTEDKPTNYIPKSGIPSMASGPEKKTKGQKKKARKRTAATEPVSGPKKKKAKLLPQTNKKKSKKAKKQMNDTKKENLTSQGDSINDEYDASHMSGFVPGGYFSDEHNEDNGYWNTNFSPDISYDSELDECVNGDDPYNYSDLDEDELGDDPYNYSDLNVDEEEEEEEEFFSDFDEENYEEDEDSYIYSSDSQLPSQHEECEDAHGNLYDPNHDGDYKLPAHVPEDLIIHSGTALKRDLLPEDNVVFKDKKYIQIVELKNQETVKVIKQPKEYQREELLKLAFKETQSLHIDSGPGQVKIKPFCEEEKDSCPELVPIVDGNGIQLCNPDKEPHDDSFDEEVDKFMSEEEDEIGSLGSEYTEICSDDTDSLMSEDINDKYLYRYNDAEDFNYSDEDNDSLFAQPNADVIDATRCIYSAGKIVQDDDESVNTENDFSHGVPTLAQGDIKADIITTQVIDKKYLKHNDIEEIEESLEKAINSKTRYVSVDETKKLDETSSIETTNNRISEDVVSSPSVSEDISQQTKLSTDRPKTSAQSLADYSSIFCSATNANLVLVLLKDPFYIYGTVRLTLLAGTVEVYGHSLIKDVEVELFSPRGCSEIEILSKLSTAKHVVTKEKLKDTLKNYESNFLKIDLDKIVNSFDHQKDAILLLKRNEERKKLVQQFKKFMNENVFPNLQNITMDRPLYDFEYLLRCMINITATEHKSLRLPEEWENFSVASNSRVMLVGGKAVGKSTLLRFLINKRITQYEKVLLIDLDIGQPELFVPQTVSCSTVQKPLLGPGFFLNLQPDKSFVVGNTNIALCPHKYVAAVSSLISYCHEQAQYRNIPWFVNTMGYNKGFGLELISVIATKMPLTDVIQLQSNKAINNFDSLLYPEVVGQTPRNMFVEDMDTGQESSQELNYRLHTWRSAVVQESRYQKEWCMSPKDMRYANMLTRLSEALQGHAEWLTDCYPISAPLDELKLVNLMDEIPSSSPDELAKAMEANLVYLCRYEDELSAVECLGIGVVRAVDFHVRQLYLIPALAAAPILKRCNSLALGETPLPSSLFTNQGSRVQNTASFVYNTIEANASKAIKQIYHRPTKFLKGNKKTFD